MSKTAILISGHMRTFSRCLPTQIWHVFRHFPNPSFFVSTVKDRDSDSAQLLRKLYPDAQIEIEVVDAQPELPIPVPPADPSWTLGRMYSHEPYGISVHPQAILRQIWQLERCWSLFHRTGSLTITDGGNPEGFDTIIRIRPDLWFRNFVCPSFNADQVPPLMAYTPYWGRFGGINDRFAILGQKAAHAYFNTYANLPALLASGCPLHPESLVKASLQQAGCVIDDTMLCEFSKLYGPEDPKKNGTFRDPEITRADIANIAARR